MSEKKIKRLEKENNKINRWLCRGVVDGLETTVLDNLIRENNRLKNQLISAMISGMNWPNNDGPSNEEWDKIAQGMDKEGMEKNN